MFKSVPVLCYHKVSYIGGITPEQFIEHLEFLVHNNYTSITANELYDFMVYNKKIPKKSVVITFDDCSLDNWVYAIPLLNKYGFKAIFFAITDFIGKGPKRSQYPDNDLPNIEDATTSFVKALRDSDTSQFMNEEELYSAVYDYGHEVYSHSARHQMCFKSLKLKGVYPKKWHWGIFGIYDVVKNGVKYFDKGSAYAYDGFWPVLKDGNIIYKKRDTKERYKFCLEDFTRSKKYLENLLGKPLDFFCWPWGHYDKLSMKALQEAGYKGSFTLERFPNSYGTNPYYINRVGIGDKKDIKWLQNRIKIYSNKITSTIFFKKFRKKDEIDKVLYITASNKFSSGGIKQLTYNIESLKKYTGLKIYLACKKNSEISKSVSEFVDRVIYVDFKKKFKSAKYLAKFINNEKISIIHTYHNGGHKLGVLTTLFNFNRNKLYVNRGVLAKPGNLLYYNNMFIDGFTCNSKKCADILGKRLLNKKKINIIYNHIKIVDLYKKDWNKENDKLVLCYIGNNNPIKGFDIFNDIFIKLKKYVEIKGIAVGINKEKVDFDIDNEITIIPETKNVFKYLSNSDIFMLTSRSESFPNVVLEAMMVGLPVICSNVGAIQEIIIDNVNGFICNNIDEFIKKTLMIIKDKHLREKMGKYNYNFVRANFEISLKSEKLLRVYSGENLTDKIEVVK